MSRTIHFWDMDHTIINNDCDVSWKEFMILKGLCGPETREKADYFYQQYLDTCLNIDEFLRFQLNEFKGNTPGKMRELCREHCIQLVEPKIYNEARKMINQQKADGDLVCLITATNRLIAEPLADTMGINHILATELEMDGPVFTGAHTDVYCCGEGKLVHMQRFIDEHDGEFENSSYFGDSTNDIPILEKVGRAYAVNSGDKLRQKATEQEWTILDFQ